MVNTGSMILADLHVHSTFSDGKLSIPELVDFYGTRGFGALGITDHLCESSTVLGRAARYLESTLTEANFPLYLEILRSEKERAWQQYRMVLIPGFELTKNSVLNHRSAHIVGLGLETFIHADGDVADLAKNIRAAGGLAIAAHPVHTRKVEKQTYHLWDRREELAQSFDAWEVASGPHLFPEVLESGLPMIATSDLHRPSQINSYKTLIDAKKNQADILEAIRKQKVSFQMYQEESNDDLVSDFCLDSLGIRPDLRKYFDLTAPPSAARNAG